MHIRLQRIALRCVYGAILCLWSAVGIQAQTITLPPAQVNQLVYVANAIDHLEATGELEKVAQAFYIIKAYDANPNLNPGAVLRVLITAQNTFDFQYKSFKEKGNYRFRMSPYDVLSNMFSILATTPGAINTAALNTESLNFYLQGNFLGNPDYLQSSSALGRARASANLENYRSNQLENLYRLARRNCNALDVVDIFYGQLFHASIKDTAKQILDSNPALRDCLNFRPLVCKLAISPDGSVATTVAEAGTTLRNFYARMKKAFDNSLQAIAYANSRQKDNYAQSYLNTNIQAEVDAEIKKFQGFNAPLLKGAAATAYFTPFTIESDPKQVEFQRNKAIMNVAARTASLAGNAAAAIGAIPNVAEVTAATLAGTADGLDLAAAAMDVADSYGAFGKSDNEIMMDGINQLSTQLSALQNRMEERLDIIDQRIGQLYDQMNTQFALVRDQLASIQYQIGLVYSAALSMQNSLLDLQSSVDRLTQNIYEFAAWEGRNPLYQVLNSIDNDIRNEVAMPSVVFNQRWDTCDIFARNYCANAPAEIGPSLLGRSYDDYNVDKELNLVPNPEWTINYLMEFARVRFANLQLNDPAMPGGFTQILPIVSPGTTVPNPRSWELSVAGLMRLAAYQPSSYLTKTVNDNAINGGGLHGARNVGQRLQEAVANITLEGFNKSPLFANLIKNQDWRAKKLTDALIGLENNRPFDNTVRNEVLDKMGTVGTSVANEVKALNGAQRILAAFTNLGLSRSVTSVQQLSALLYSPQRLPDGDLVRNLYLNWQAGQPNPRLTFATMQAERSQATTKQYNEILDRLTLDTIPGNRVGEPLTAVDVMLRRIDTYTRPFISGKVSPVQGAFLSDKPVTLYFKGGSGTIKVLAYLDADSKFSVQLPVDVYELYAKANKFLMKKFNLSLAMGLGNIPSANNNTIIDMKLAVGDVNNDNRVDSVDMILVRNALGSQAASANWNPNADLNYDGKVDNTDINLLKTALGSTVNGKIYDSRADLNSNSQVNNTDLAIFRQAFGARPGNSHWNAVADINSDGAINDLDLTAWNKACDGYAQSANWNALYDVNSDGIVNDTDYYLVRRAKGATPGTTYWNSKLDVNGNGVINEQDMALVEARLGTTTASQNWNPKADLNNDKWVDDLDLAILRLSLYTLPSHTQWNVKADINGDGVINERDLILLNNALGTSPSSPAWNIRADLNCDGYVDDNDMAILLAANGSVAANRNWNPNADLDGNGVVNMTDMNMLRFNWGRTGDKLTP